MPQIVSQDNFNPAALQASDLYVVITPPPSFITGVPTDVFGAVGTASWGPVDTPILTGSPADAVAAFGPRSVAALTDIHDLINDMILAYTQAGQGGGTMQGFGVRVTDGSDTPAQGLIEDVGQQAVAVLQGIYTGALGNNLQMILSPGAYPNTTSVTLKPFNGAAAETFINIPNAGFADTLKRYLAQGQNSVRGPSKLMRVVMIGTPTTITGEAGTPAQTPNDVIKTFTDALLHGNVQPGTLVVTDSHNVTFTDKQGVGTLVSNQVGASGTVDYASGAISFTYATAAPTGTTFSYGYKYGVANNNVPPSQTVVFSGGTDGRAGVTAAMLLGNDTSVPKTGAYSLRSQIPNVGVAWICGLGAVAGDSSIYALAAALADSEGMAWVFTFPTGTTSQDAVTLKQGYGITSYNVIFVKDWLYIFDATNNVTRLMPPTAVFGGRLATLNPSLSPGNKSVLGVYGTERFNTTTGNIVAYSLAEAGLLESNGITFITNPVPGGAYFGIRNGMSASADQVTGPIEYGRMTNFIAKSLAQFMGVFVGQNQSSQPQDPLRNAVKTMLDGFFSSLANAQFPMIDSWLSICGFQASGSPQAGYNTPETISHHYLYALAKVRYLSSVRFFILSLLGGTTVVTVANSVEQQQPLAA